ncbi:hypothetical protein ACFVVC_04350 [Pseudarthrobacter sp. NPDC058196]|uniref:hypothetical protein n=1 Tax=Pseudarthrobacter sp. NPDC058196 TaxID=3346376 RepID=UPI0036D932A7
MFDGSRVFPRFAYGYAFWVCEDGVYYCDGTDGQYLIVVPASELVIVTTGSHPDMKAITRYMLAKVADAAKAVEIGEDAHLDHPAFTVTWRWS